MAELIVRNLNHRYGERATVRDVDLSLRSGRVHALIGPTGAGKSTLMALVAGVVAPASGTVEERLQAGDESNGAARLGVVFQPAGLWEHMTAAQHLRLVLKPTGLGRSAREARVAHYLERLGLVALRDRVPAKLSSGQRQRLAIARAMVVEPRWLLLDEPLAHLDGSARNELLGLLRELLAGCGAGVLLITHLPGEAMAIADELSVMIDGRVVQTGEPEHVYRQPTDLEVARLLGGASELTGEVRGGVLMIAGVEALSGVSGPDGRRTLIVRAEDLAFTPDAQGPAEVRACRFTGGAYVLRVDVAGASVSVRSDRPIEPGTQGRVNWVN